MSSLPDYLTPPEAAKLLRVDPETVIGWIRAGELRASNLARRGTTRPRFRIAREAIDAFLAGREVHRRATPRKRTTGRVIKFF